MPQNASRTDEQTEKLRGKDQGGLTIIELDFHEERRGKNKSDKAIFEEKMAENFKK